MDSLVHHTYHEAISALQVRFGRNREAFASLWIPLALYSKMLRTTTFLGVRVSVIRVNYNVPLPQKKTKNCQFLLLSTLLTQSEWAVFPTSAHSATLWTPIGCPTIQF